MDSDGISIAYVSTMFGLWNLIIFIPVFAYVDKQIFLNTKNYTHTERQQLACILFLLFYCFIWFCRILIFCEALDLDWGNKFVLEFYSNLMLISSPQDSGKKRVQMYIFVIKWAPNIKNRVKLENKKKFGAECRNQETCRSNRLLSLIM